MDDNPEDTLIRLIIRDETVLIRMYLLKQAEGTKTGSFNRVYNGTGFMLNC